MIVCPDAHFGHHTLDLTPHKHTHTHTISLFIFVGGFKSVDYTGLSSS